MEALLKKESKVEFAISSEARRVRDVLVERGLETPMLHNGLSRDEKYQRIRESFTDIAETEGIARPMFRVCGSTNQRKFVIRDGQ